MYADLMVDHDEGGITVYSTENEHYDLAVLRTLNESQIVFKRNIGGIKHIEKAIPLPPSNTVRLIIKADSLTYSFYAVVDGKEVLLGTALSKYVSTEVSGGFTGVILAFYAIGNNKVCITYLVISNLNLLLLHTLSVKWISISFQSAGTSYPITPFIFLPAAMVPSN